MGNLNKVQKLQFEMAKEVARVCEENNISYFICGGTFLGAIRHKGFIPWDDDMDFGMTRDNFERFLEIAQKELGEKYFVQTWNTDPGYALPFAKIRLNGTQYVEKNSQAANMNKGIYVDIFPWDNIADDETDKKKQWYSVHLFWHLLMNKCNYDYINKTNMLKRIVALGLKIASKLFPLEFIHKKLYSNLTKYRSCETEKAANFCEGSPMTKEIWDRKWLKEFEKYQFEDTFFYGPKDWDGCLSHFFGDYMTPPPENERLAGHGIIKIDLGKYEDI